MNSIGVLSFNGSVLELEPQPFPSSVPLISPYWASVDFAQGGEVYHRTTNDQQLLEQAQEDVLSQFPDLNGLFVPTSLLVVTWFEMLEFEGGNEVSCFVFVVVITLVVIAALKQLLKFFAA